MHLGALCTSFIPFITMMCQIPLRGETGNDAEACGRCAEQRKVSIKWNSGTGVQTKHWHVPSDTTRVSVFRGGMYGKLKKRSNANIITSLDSHWSDERVFSRRQNHTTFLFNTEHLLNGCSECFPITDAYIIVSLHKTHAHTQYSCSILSDFVQHGLFKILLKTATTNLSHTLL